MEWAVGDPCAVGLALAGALREDRAERLDAGVYAAELGAALERARLRGRSSRSPRSARVGREPHGAAGRGALFERVSIVLVVEVGVARSALVGDDGC